MQSNKSQITDIIDSYKNGESYILPMPLQDNGALTVICSNEFSDYLNVDDNGELCGIEVDIIRAVLALMGYTAVFVLSDFKDMFDALEAGEGDLIASGVEKTVECETAFSFSEPYFTISYDIIVRGKN